MISANLARRYWDILIPSNPVSVVKSAVVATCAECGSRAGIFTWLRQGVGTIPDKQVPLCRKCLLDFQLPLHADVK